MLFFAKTFSSRLAVMGALLLGLTAGPVPARADAWLVANYGNGSISTVDGAGGVHPFTTGLHSPRGLAFAGGNLFVADGGTVVKIAPNGTASTFARGFGTLRGLACDSHGDLYASDIVTDIIYKFSPTGAPSKFARVATHPFALAFDGRGNLYVAASTQICKVSSTGVVSVVATGLTNTRGLAVDAGGNVFAGQAVSGAASAVGAISRVAADGKVSTFANLPYIPEFLAFDASGNLLVSSLAGGVIYKINKAGSVGTLATGLSSPLGLTAFAPAVATPTVPAPPTGPAIIPVAHGATPTVAAAANPPLYPIIATAIVAGVALLFFLCGIIGWRVEARRQKQNETRS